MSFKFTYLLFILMPAAVAAQEISSDQLYNNINKERSLRITYENDYFAASDEYYTQGISITAELPALQKIPIYRLNLGIPGSQVKYGLSVQHNAYTPTSIRDTALRVGDQPYAASLFLQLYKITTDNARKQRLTSTITAGVIGPAAGGEWLQKTIHEQTGNAEPQGWKYQVANDIALNYRLNYQRNLVQAGKVFAINGTACANAGTLNTSLGLGVQIMLGHFDLFEEPADQAKFRFRLYDQPQVILIGYDAILQGGLFSNDIYTIATGDIKRIQFQNRYGVVLSYGNFNLEYYLALATPSFEGASQHNWGGVSLGFAF